MYLKYFGLTERPFSIAPDPHYLYMSNRHKEAMAHLTYGLSQGGCFIVLTGEVGTGKTTLCRNLLSDLPENVDVALILNANINEQELLQTVCDELQVDYPESASQKQLLDLINAHLLATFAANRHTVLIIDEAQLLSRDVLENIRLLTNLETTKSKLLQIILIGQPELNDSLRRNDLRQLAQRVTARYHLGPLERDEIADYVNFRLAVAGCKQPLFSRQALNRLHSLSGGIPRKINVLADHALLSAYAKTQSMVDSKSVKAAAKEVFIDGNAAPTGGEINNRHWWSLAALLIVLNAGLWWYFVGSDRVAEHRLVSAMEEQTVATESASNRLETADSSNVATVTGGASASPVVGPNQNAVDESKTDDAQLTTIIKSDDIDPGLVVIADEFLDEADDTSIPSLLPATPRRPTYDDNSAFGAILDTSADVTGRISALRNLAQAWDVVLPAELINSPCDELSREGVACTDASSWDQLMRLNRPAVVVLEQRGQLHRAILFSVEQSQAQLLIGDKVHSLTVSELKARWARPATVLWRPGTMGAGLLQMGDRSARVARLRNRLNTALNVADMPLLAQVNEPQFDLDLAQKVFALQSRFGIVADSKVGSETYILMNELIAPDSTPVLRRRRP
ncbi:hypothetical protein GCM10008090_22590 [Arenicella chitinivorans]|uniref:AAA+ ATPase domain-containing protein n=1 Tax=Arenicella chitinivorans TaxID=1329800 RepID=A0A918RU91_9GAMM|nr:AAA family ATPase [Arenicella chitinivorans]GHA12195.1 hypothetical protein GCM10008090_22590 [Arenicella chitinivorans]